MTPATVVLVHGMGGSPAAWSRVIPLLDELGVPNVAVQLPSGLPESAMDDAACVRSLLDESVDPVVLVGHSSGGMVADRSRRPSAGEASRLSGRAHARCRRRSVRGDGGRIPGRVHRVHASAGRRIRVGHGRVRRVLRRDGAGPPPTLRSSCSVAGPNTPPRRCWRTLKRHGGRFRPPSCPVTTAR